ncbi:hypothetical protein DES49_0664 [Halospina denitrificans]|uniref:Wadjet protein JetD C-terminal domain-containing protein n=1 Tax=Halospina denitrificans TaxID=332522 RepID=A0A4R7K3H6_9GAMM|nr:hypothetical protein [Halospina denitrificans]TDT44553.1 hypothetical protein DES49_0664 [Halospina denitrificans]
MNQALAAALAKLAENEEKARSSSAFTQAQRRALDEFIQQTGCIRVYRKGRGWGYEVCNQTLFNRHLQELRPDRDSDLASDLNDRARNIATRRSSKAGQHQHDLYYLLLKASGSGVQWFNDEGVTLELSESTDAYGLGALQVAPSDTWRTDQPLWLIENQALFDSLDWVEPALGGSVAYYAGNLTNNLLRWLESRQRASQVILFPDYDGTGLENYARLKTAIGDQASFWLMPGWKALLARYGNRTIWQDNLVTFETARQRLKWLAPEDRVHELIEELAFWGMMLEQEAIGLISGEFTSGPTTQG